MSTIKLLQSQRNELLKEIESANMDPSDFVWKDVESSFEEDGFGVAYRVSQLVHRDTGFFFTFDLKNGKHYAIFSPGSDHALEQGYPGSWAYQLDYFRRWLENVSRETQEKDLWSAFAEQIKAVVSRPPMALEESEFSPEERSNLEEKLDEISGRIESLSGMHEGINGQISYLRHAIERQSKRDWFFLFVGVLVTLGSSLVLTPEQGAEVVAYLRMVVGQVFRMLSSGGG